MHNTLFFAQNNRVVNKAYLTISETTRNVDSQGETLSLKVDSNVKWVVSSNQLWLHTNKSSGDGSLTISVDIDQNLTIEKRIGILTFQDSEGRGLSATLTVTQEAAEEYLRLETSSITFVNPSDTSITGSFKILSNASWSITYKPEEFNFSTLEGTGDTTITVKLINPLYIKDSKEYEVEIENSDGTDYVYFYINVSGFGNISIKVVPDENIPELQVKDLNHSTYTKIAELDQYSKNYIMQYPEMINELWSENNLNCINNYEIEVEYLGERNKLSFVPIYDNFFQKGKGYNGMNYIWRFHTTLGDDRSDYNNRASAIQGFSIYSDEPQTVYLEGGYGKDSVGNYLTKCIYEIGYQRPNELNPNECSSWAGEGIYSESSGGISFNSIRDNGGGTNFKCVVIISNDDYSYTTYLITKWDGDRISTGSTIEPTKYSGYKIIINAGQQTFPEGYTPTKVDDYPE